MHDHVFFWPPQVNGRAEGLRNLLGNPSTTMMTVIRIAPWNGLIPERYLAWLFENSTKLPFKRLMPWSDDVPPSCKALGK